MRLEGMRHKRQAIRHPRQIERRLPPATGSWPVRRWAGTKPRTALDSRLFSCRLRMDLQGIIPDLGKQSGLHHWQWHCTTGEAPH
jgi:hypothetical protein